MSYCAKCPCGQVFMGKGKMPKDQRCALCRTPKSKKTDECKHGEYFRYLNQYGDDRFECGECGKDAQDIIKDLQKQVVKLEKSKARLKKKVAKLETEIETPSWRGYGK